MNKKVHAKTQRKEEPKKAKKHSASSVFLFFASLREPTAFPVIRFTAKHSPQTTLNRLKTENRKTALHIWNPEQLLAGHDGAQAALGQLFFFEAEIGEVRQVAQHGLKPAMLGKDFAHAWVQEFVNI